VVDQLDMQDAVMVGGVEPCKLACYSFWPSNPFVECAAALYASSRDTTESLSNRGEHGKA
jgi:hypothetical protein